MAVVAFRVPGTATFRSAPLSRGVVAAPDNGPVIGSRALWPSGTPRTGGGAPELTAERSRVPQRGDDERGAGRAPARGPAGGARLILMRGSNDNDRYRSLARGLGWGCGWAAAPTAAGWPARRWPGRHAACRAGTTRHAPRRPRRPQLCHRRTVSYHPSCERRV